MGSRFRHDDKGFTLIELLIVVAIMGIVRGGLRGFSTPGGDIPHFLPGNREEQ